MRRGTGTGYVIHYSANLVVTAHSTPQSRGIEFSLKPSGLWVSVGNAWQKWCQCEEFNLEGLTHSQEVVLSPEANILYLTSEKELNEFTAEYKGVDPNWDFVRGIIWERASTDYQGIIINPYQREKQFHSDMLWYYGWDCASGCIWDAKAIESIKQI